MIKDIYYWDYFNSLIQGNKHRCREIVVSLLEAETDIKEIYTGLLQKSLYKIGKMWEEGKVSIAEEHLAAKITEHLVDFAMQQKDIASSTGKSIILTCVDKEFHDIGARMVSNIFEINGWQVYFLGANTPRNEVLSLIEIRKPDVLGISFSLYINFIRFIELVDAVYNKFPNQNILIGGQGLFNDNFNALEKYPSAKYIFSLKDLEKYITTF
jgi:methanogenic corrinoid protein MtbC1